MHAQHITDQQLKETRTNTPDDTIIFVLMSPEKPNTGKLVQLSEGFLIKQYQSTIWVSKLAYPTNFLSSNTSRFLTNLLVETPDNPSGSYSAPICPRNPSICLIWTASAFPSPTLALHQPILACDSPRRSYISSLRLYISYASPSSALCNT